MSKQKNISGDSISFYDKVSLKFANWNEDDFKKSQKNLKYAYNKIITLE